MILSSEKYLRNTWIVDHPHPFQMAPMHEAVGRVVIRGILPLKFTYSESKRCYATVELGESARSDIPRPETTSPSQNCSL